MRVPEVVAGLAAGGHLKNAVAFNAVLHSGKAVFGDGLRLSNDGLVACQTDGKLHHCSIRHQMLVVVAYHPGLYPDGLAHREERHRCCFYGC
jgi:hypothetical protein